MCDFCAQSYNEEWYTEAIKNHKQLIKNRQEDIDRATQLIVSYEKELEKLRNATKVKNN